MSLWWWWWWWWWSEFCSNNGHGIRVVPAKELVASLAKDEECVVSIRVFSKEGKKGSPRNIFPLLPRCKSTCTTPYWSTGISLTFACTLSSLVLTHSSSTCTMMDLYGKEQILIFSSPVFDMFVVWDCEMSKSCICICVLQLYQYVCSFDYWLLSFSV